jgi:hypothetical protein
MTPLYEEREEYILLTVLLFGFKKKLTFDLL